MHDTNSLKAASLDYFELASECFKLAEELKGGGIVKSEDVSDLIKRSNQNMHNIAAILATLEQKNREGMDNIAVTLATLQHLQHIKATLEQQMK